KTSPGLTMPSSLRARSSTAAPPALRSATSAASASLRCCSSRFSACCAATCARRVATSRWPPLPSHRVYCSQASNSSSASSSTRTGFTRARPRSTRQRDERGAAGVARGCAQRLLDAQQLVVLGHAVAAAQRAGLDLGGGGRHRDVGDRGVLGL